MSQRIAITSQNRRSITPHAGKCCNFRIFDVVAGQILSHGLRELPFADALRSSAAARPHPLDDVQVLITRGVGSGLAQMLAERGIHAVMTDETDPEAAVRAWLAGSLQASPALSRPGLCRQADAKA